MKGKDDRVSFRNCFYHCPASALFLVGHGETCREEEMSKKRRLRLKHKTVYIQDIYEDRYGRHWLRERIRDGETKFYRIQLTEQGTIEKWGYEVTPVGQFLTDPEVILE